MATFIQVRRARERLVVVVFLGAVVLLVLSLLWWLYPNVSRTNYEVDIRSGRIRLTHFFLTRQTSQQIEESPISKLLPPPTTQPDWHYVVTSELGSNVRAHWNFHGAIAQMSRLETLWLMTRFTDDAKREVARNVLNLWQDSGSYFDAGTYIQTLEAASDRASTKPGTILTIADLPPPATQPATGR
jgi:hypothetical protein